MQMITIFLSQNAHRGKIHTARDSGHVDEKFSIYVQDFPTKTARESGHVDEKFSIYIPDFPTKTARDSGHVDEKFSIYIAL